jgi:osmotically-inducible protein OsmY
MGTIFDEREREALRVAAENVLGVKQVKISWFGSSRYPA